MTTVFTRKARPLGVGRLFVIPQRHVLAAATTHCVAILVHSGQRPDQRSCVPFFPNGRNSP